jgi:hypothetical protein
VVASPCSHRTRSAPGYVQRRRGRVDPGHFDAAVGKQAGQRAGAAADVEHAAGTQLVSDRQVVIEVAALPLHEVVDLG